MLILFLITIEGIYWYHQYIKDDHVIVAVIDTGVQFDYKTMKGKEIYPVDLVDFDWTPEDKEGHGTHIAGIINHLSPESKIMPVKMLKEGKKPGKTIPSGIAILYTVMRGADVVNMSYSQMEEDPITKAAIWYGRKHGVIFTAATGNEGVDFEGFPASIPDVISVASVYDDNSLFEYSNIGKHTIFAAPGVAVKSLNNHPKKKEDILVPKTGTSMATAHMSGVIAYLLEKHPTWNQNQIQAYLAKMSYPVSNGKERDVSRLRAVSYKKIQAAEEHTPYLYVSGNPEATSEDTVSLNVDVLHNTSITLIDGKGTHTLPNESQTVRVSLREGYNNIQVKAMNGNVHTFVDSKRILKDTTKPKIEYVMTKTERGKPSHMIYIEDYNVEKAEVNGENQMDNVFSMYQEKEQMGSFLLATSINTFPLHVKIEDKAGNTEEIVIKQPKK